MADAGQEKLRRSVLGRRRWLWLLGAGCVGMARAQGRGATAAAPEPPEGARRLVARQRLGSGLGRMAMAAATGTQTYSMLTDRLGAPEAAAVVLQEIERLVPRSQQAWDQQLASAYARHFSATELASLADRGRASPFALQAMRKQPAVGAEMHALSASLVRDLVSEALRSAWAALPDVRP